MPADSTFQVKLRALIENLRHQQLQTVVALQNVSDKRSDYAKSLIKVIDVQNKLIELAEVYKEDF
jgi:hypothetical protein